MVQLTLFLSLSAIVISQASAAAIGSDFNPSEYTKRFVSCNAVERGNGSSRDIKLKLAYLDINPTAKKTLIMVHGWPSLWTTYRNQIAAFGKEYRLILPEHRGYGDSEHPKDLESSNAMFDFVNDMICMLDDAKVTGGVCIGNDFGAQVCWEAARARPDRFIAAFNIGIPYVSAALGLTPNRGLAKLNPHFGYQVYLDESQDAAAKELDADPRMAIRSCAQVAASKLPEDFLTRNDSFLDPWKTFIKAQGLKEIPFSGIMSPAVETYMVESYKKQGFLNTFNGYQMENRKLTYEHETKQGNYSIPTPTFTLFMTKDPVADWEGFAKQANSSTYLTNHYNQTIDTAHWPHEEKPAEFNAILRQWLGNVTFS